MLALIRFPFRPDLSRQRQHDLFEMYIASLMHYGQVIGSDYNYVWKQDVLEVYAEIPRPDALAPQYHSSYGRQRLENLQEGLTGDLHWELLQDAPARYPRLNSASFLYLYHEVAETADSPVCRARDGKSHPLYLLPVDQECRLSIHRWQLERETYWAAWFDSGPLEIAAWRLMADPNSEHNQWGRELCRQIEEGTKIPTYYFLERYYGRRHGEEDRPCPVCGKQWRVQWPADKKKPFYHFDFKCENCRVVSIRGNDKNDRYAKIGDFIKR